MTDCWNSLVEQYAPKYDKLYRDSLTGTVYEFFGLVHASDDYYYGLWDVENKKLLLSTCVGSLESFYEELGSVAEID